MFNVIIAVLAALAVGGDLDGDLREGCPSWNVGLCVSGPGQEPHAPWCYMFDMDADGDVDLADYAEMQMSFVCVIIEPPPH